MSNLVKVLLMSVVVSGALAPATARAEEPRSMSCSVAVDFLFNGVLRAHYLKEFVVTPTTAFGEFTFTPSGRATIFDAWTYPEVGTGNTIVAMSFYKDVGVFDAIDLSTYLTIHDDKAPETTSGSHSYYTSQGAAGNRTTNYRLTCTRLKH